MSLRPKKIDFDAVFKDFERVLANMYNYANVKCSGIDLVHQVYDMCTAHPRPHTEALFTAIGNFLSDHASRLSQTILLHDDIVTSYAAEWEKYQTATTYTNQICNHLNKMLAKMRDPNNRARNVGDGRFRKMSIEALAYHIWKEQVLYGIKHEHSNRLVYQLLDMMRRDRDGETVSHDIIRKSINSLVELNQHTEQPLYIYIEEFEKPYLASIRDYYMRESNAVISTGSISEFMKKASIRLEEEAARNTRFCDSTSHEKVIKECESQYITAHKARLYSEFETMVLNERNDDCTTAYTLLSRIPDGVVPLLESFEMFIASLGNNTIARLGASVLKDPKKYVESLMSLHSKYMDFCQIVFNNDAAFVAAVDKAFRIVINDSSLNSVASSAEILAKYCDLLLKKSTKLSAGEVEVEEKLGQVIILFKYVEDKDVFQKFYSRMLAKRLIYGTSISEESESSMISRLKNACGVEYTSKLQRMFTDVAISSDVTTKFKKLSEGSAVSYGVDTSVMVLTAGSWPLTGLSSVEFQLPMELEKSVARFTAFYTTQHNGRKLTWLNHLSRADVRLTFCDKRYELNVSLHQLGVLLAFNQDATTLSLKDIQEHTKLPVGDATRILKTFQEIKLIKPSKEGGDSPTFDLNLNFTSKRMKIKVSTAMQMETPQETDATRKAVDDDRKLYMQAAIVRIMKSRKDLSHTHLVQEAIDQAKSRFSPSIPMIKKCIEQLIEKQYIDRSKEHRDRYIYIS